MASGILHHPISPCFQWSCCESCSNCEAGPKKVTQGSLNDQLARFLFSYQTTPHSTTGITPAELLLGRNSQTRFHQLYPNRKQVIEEHQLRQKRDHDRQAKWRTFELGDQVFVCNFRPKGPRWVSGEIKEQRGPVSFMVLVEGRQLWRRHVDQIRRQYDFDSCRDNSEPDLEHQLPALSHPPIRSEVEEGCTWPSPPEEVEVHWETQKRELTNHLQSSTRLPMLLSRKSTETLSYSSLEATRPTAILRGKRCSDSSELLYGVRL